MENPPLVEANKLTAPPKTRRTKDALSQKCMDKMGEALSIEDALKTVMNYLF